MTRKLSGPFLVIVGFSWFSATQANLGLVSFTALLLLFVAACLDYALD